VAVVSCRAGDEPHGTTVNGFTSVSLDPPLVLVAINRHSKLCARITQQCFAISILGQDGQAHALHFAGHHQPQLTIQWNVDGVAPRLAGTVAYLECSPWRTYDGGDHVLQVGRVEQFGAAPGKPLLFYSSAFYALGGAIPRGSS
jgi:flavin reductase (DIM6/NTAB) family NADH-FMN oxidoreductase RutF